MRILFAEFGSPSSDWLKCMIDDEPNMELVSVTRNRGVRLLSDVREARPHVILIGASDDNIPGECSHIVSEFPYAAILVMPMNDASMSSGDMIAQTTPRTAAHNENVIVAIRTAARRRNSIQHVVPTPHETDA